MPAKIDSISRLSGWLEKSATADVSFDPHARMIADALDKNGLDGWLYHLGEYRNTFVHREPLSVNENSRFLRLVERSSAYDSILLLQMDIPDRPKSTNLCDTLEQFNGLHARLCSLATALGNEAKYPPQIPYLARAPT